MIDVLFFILKGDEIGDVLCVFDLYCKFVFGVSFEEFGLMIKVNISF